MNDSIIKELEWQRHLLYTILVNQEKQENNFMGALDDVRANLDALRTDVQTLLDKPSGGVPEVEVQNIADELAALDQLVKAGL